MSLRGDVLKKVLKSLGKSVLYLGIFLTQQLSVSSVFTVFLSLFHYGASEEELLNIFYQYVSLLTFLSGVTTLFILWLFFKLMDRSPAKSCGMAKTDIKALLLSALAGAGSCVAVLLMMAVVPFPEAWMDVYNEESAVLSEGLDIFTVLATVVMAPIIEEIIFRGLIYRSLRSAMPRVVAALLTSVTFGVVHGTIIWFIYTFLLSLLLIFLLEATGSLLSCIVAHAAFNIVGQLPLITEDTHAVTVVIIFAVGIALFAISLILMYDYGRDRKDALLCAQPPVFVPEE